MICPQCKHLNHESADVCENCHWRLKCDPILDTKEVYFTPEKNINFNWESLNSYQIQSDTEEFGNSKSLNQLDSFIINALIGKGGMGDVYLARDEVLHRNVAIKVLRSSAKQSYASDILLEEARIISQLNHPNIVTVYDVARSNNHDYIVMEWVKGSSLDELLPYNGFTVRKAVNYALQIAKGLSFAHEQLIIHKDIKPKNIMLNSQGEIKILDFGISDLINPKKSSCHNQLEERVIGTPKYMSPEQINNEHLDHRSDIFSFGVVFYQMLCGQSPFRENSIELLYDDIRSGRFTPIQKIKPGLPQRVTSVLEKMLAIERQDRWQNTRELSIELIDIYKELTYQKNWWKRRHWVTKGMLVSMCVTTLVWSVQDIVFPPSTQQLIDRQLKEATKIAIMPFENISGDPQLQLFSDGLSVNLGTDLSSIANSQGDLWIIPSTEIRRIENANPELISNKFGVNLSLAGSIQHMGSTRLIVLNLINSQNRQQLKTVEISINADELYQGYELIREKTLSLLNWSVPEQLKDQFQSQRPQLDGAYKAYIIGKGHLYRYDLDDNIENALNAFNHAIALDPNYESAYVGLIETLLLNFDKTKDIRWLEAVSKEINKLQSINPQNTQINYLKAESERKLGNYDLASDLYRLSINQNPTLIKAKRGLAKSYSHLGNHEKAEQTYIAASQMAKNNWNVISDLGMFYFRNGKYKNSLRQFQKLIEISPNNHFGFSLTAASYYAMGEIEKAIEYTQKSIEINSTDNAYSNLGTMYFSLGKYNEAIESYEKAIQISDTNFNIWGNLGDAYKLVNSPKSIDSYTMAVELAQKSLSINPNNTSVKVDLAYYLSHLSRAEEAIEYLNEIGEAHSGMEHFIAAQTYDQLGLIEQSIMHLQTAITKNYPINEIINTPLLNRSRKHHQFQKLIVSHLTE